MRALISGIRLIFRLALLAAVLLAVGFAGFVMSMERDKLPDGRNADAIVALTGGKARIGEAVRLLSDGRAKRMLITGVHPTTTGKQLGELVPAGAELFECCIDLGRDAQDTIGNAIETRAWVDEHQYKSVIVVTSSYHMPRTLIELGHAMPDTEIIPHAVEPVSFRSSSWWADRDVLRLIISEYAKYVSTLIRLSAARLGIDLDLGA